MLGVPDTLYIVKRLDAYCIYKKINGKSVYFGSAKTLIIALMRRDLLVANNWEHIPWVSDGSIIKTDAGNFMVRKCRRVNGKLITRSYGTYGSYDDAERELSLLQKYDWDYDVVCECLDERVDDGDVIWLNRRMY